MSKTGSIILIEDDYEDEEIFRAALLQIGVKNEIKWFPNTAKAYDYLKQMTEQPFLIFCDINLPLESGIEFKSRLDEDILLRKKSIPFIFYSTSVDKYVVTTAYTQLIIQGFFRKEHKYTDIVNSLSTIINYWRLCEHPASF